MRRSLPLCTTAVVLLSTAASFSQHTVRRAAMPVQSTARRHHFHPALHLKQAGPNLHETITRGRNRIYCSSDGQESSSDENTQTTPIILSAAMMAFPVASLIFPALLLLARSLTPNSSEQFAAVLALFVTNRTYLYLMAATIVGLAATRGSNDVIQLGRRISDLTEELLYRPTLNNGFEAADARYVYDGKSTQEDKPFFIRSLTDSGLQDSLDEVSTETQALLLPLLVSFLLALSIFFLPFWSGSPSLLEGTGVSLGLQGLVSRVFPTITQIWNVGLLTLFTRSELRRLGYETRIIPDSMAFEWVAAVCITGLAWWTQSWPAQNFVNMSLAILVARAIQLNSFQAVVGALSLLTLYDATSVFLVPAAGASDLCMENSEILLCSTTTMATASDSAAADSAMGSVVIQKLTSGTFQPGLLVTKIGDRLGGSLGLGDAVFPSLLANFVKRFDESKQVKEDRLSLFGISMIGYLLGCFACEFAPLISTSGLPALTFIIPIMLGSVIVASSLSGELDSLFNFKPTQTT